ncbi:TIR domain-containing protein [Streptomyces hokutonensis]|uniref:TIR domain-containing protein n=1 Tax=Streptomyces hokutonensis TaxID=1306990 RepID=UPI0037F55711
MKRLRWRPLQQSGAKQGYDVFISYSRARDSLIVDALRKGLFHYARPWYQPRAVRVFSDTTSLPLTDALWSEIEGRLRRSSWFVLLASPEAAASVWVEREVQWWLKNKSPRTLLVVITSGSAEPDHDADDFDWARSTALPQALKGAFRELPAYEPLQWVHERGPEQVLDLNHPEFRLAVARLSATIRNRQLEDLEGEDVRQHRLRRRVIWSAALSLACLTVTSSTLAMLASNSAATAREERDTAISRQLIAEGRALENSQPNLSHQLAVLGYHRTKETDDAVGSLISTVGVPGSFVVPNIAKEFAYAPTLAFRSDGGLLAAGANGEVVLQNLHRNRTASVIEGDNGYFTALAISPDGKILAGGDGFGDMGGSSVAGKISLWDISSPDRPLRLRTLTGHSRGIVSLAFDAVGKRLLSAGVDGSVLLWDVSSPGQPPPPVRIRKSGQLITRAQLRPDGRAAIVEGTDGLEVWDLSDLSHPRNGGSLGMGKQLAATTFAPTGTTVAVADDDTVSLWDISDPLRPRRQRQFYPEGGKFDSLTFAGTDTLLAITTDGTVHVLDLTAQNAGEESAFPGRGSEPAVDAAGRHLALSSRDGTVRIWDITDPVFLGAAAVLHSAATDLNDRVVLAPDGKAAVTIDKQQVAILWDLHGTRRPRPHPLMVDGQPLPLGSVAFAPDGDLLAGRSGNVIRLWDASDASPANDLGVIPASGEATGDVVFRPHGRQLMAAGNHGSVLRWDLSDPSHPTSLAHLRTGQFTGLSALAVSPDGNSVTAQSTDGHTTYRWNTGRDGGAPNADRLRLPSSTTDTTLSPDGRLAATVTKDNAVRIWRVSTDEAPRRLSSLAHPSGMVGHLLFSADSERLAVGDATGSVSLWDLNEPTRPVVLASFVAEATSPEAFSPDGERLALRDGNGDTALFDLDPETLVSRLCEGVGSAITREQWAQYVGDDVYEPPCT